MGPHARLFRIVATVATALVHLAGFGAAHASAQPIATELSVLPFGSAAGTNTLRGAAVALDGDLALVGMPGTGAGINGVVYVFARDPMTHLWSLETTLMDPDFAPTGDQFGASVALRGDTAVIGAPGHAMTAGAAWYFERTGPGAWTPHRLAPTATGAASRFGTSVALSATWVAVGAPDSGTGVRAGAVYVYSVATAAAGGLPTMAMPDLVARPDHVASVVDASGTAPDPTIRYGAAVAMAGDTLLVGAPSDAQMAVAGGAAFSLEAPFSSAAALRISVAMGELGGSVAIAPDGTFAVLGARGDGGTGAGYVVTRSSAGMAWSDPALGRITANDTVTGDYLGTSVAATNDAIVLGAPNRGGTPSQFGSAYLFQRQASTWVETSRYDSMMPVMNEHLGTSVAVSGTTVIAGATGPAGRAGFASEFPFPLALATMCTLDFRCASGHCVDGVCCESACGGGDRSDCVACSTAQGGSANGMCTAARETMSCTTCGAGTCASGACMVACDAGPIGDDAGSGFDGGVPADAGPRPHVSGCKCEVGLHGTMSLETWVLTCVWVALSWRRRRRPRHLATSREPDTSRRALTDERGAAP